MEIGPKGGSEIEVVLAEARDARRVGKKGLA
jgi:hypothetical protein